MALGFEEKAFLYDALVFFKRTFDPIHMIAVSIWHPTNDLVIARSRVTKKHIRNASNYFTNGELMHRLNPPRVRTICSTNALQRLRRKNGRNQFFCRHDGGCTVHACRRAEQLSRSRSSQDMPAEPAQAPGVAPLAYTAPKHAADSGVRPCGGCDSLTLPIGRNGCDGASSLWLSVAWRRPLCNASRERGRRPIRRARSR